VKEKRVLVIDDDEAVLRPIAEILKLEGYSVDTARDGKEAIRKSNTNFYNLALIDIRLPDMEGTKLLTAMRETTPRMVKIIFTGYPTLENAVEATNRSADGYVIKPIEMEKLLDMIKEHLKKQEDMAKQIEQTITNSSSRKRRKKPAKR